MSLIKIIVGILLFAAATSILYVWGLRKSMGQQADLAHLLQNKCAGRVVRYLRRHGVITLREMEPLVRGVRAGEFWSKQRVEVKHPASFAKELSAFLLSQQVIESTGKKGEFCLKKQAQ